LGNHVWAGLAAAVVLFAVWSFFSRRRIRRLDAKHGFSIVVLPMRSARIQAFHEGVPAFSVPMELDSVPPLVNFTAALPFIPDADAPAWRERLCEYLKERWGPVEIV
jgi:hypothetical protein